jgi:branched-chain amino acid aminotransferase
MTPSIGEVPVIHRQVVHNGRLLDIGEVRLSPGQAGLLNGWGLFTTVRIVEGEAFAWERHWKRLQKDAALTHIPMPFDGQAVRAQLAQVIHANRVTEGCARVYVVYNAVGHWRSDEGFPKVDLILYTADLPAYREPVRLGLREHGRHAGSPLAGVKTTSWLNNVWNLHEAQQAGFDEVVLLNEHGHVAECTAANVFCVRGGQVLTPPLASGCLEGVTRGLLLELGPKRGIRVSEADLKPEDLYTADEVFISSTNRNLLAVGEVNGHKLPAAPGAVTRELDLAFAAYQEEYIAEAKKAGASR